MTSRQPVPSLQSQLFALGSATKSMRADRNLRENERLLLLEHLDAIKTTLSWCEVNQTDLRQFMKHRVLLLEFLKEKGL